MRSYEGWLACDAGAGDDDEPKRYPAGRRAAVPVMANLITFGDDTTYWVRMSNLLTEVFMEVLALSGSELARLEWEIDTVVWLAAHDQAVMGLGMVGFSVADLGWTSEQLDEQKAFLLRVIDGALGRVGWERLGYQPNRPCIKARVTGRKVAKLAGSHGEPAHDVRVGCLGVGDRKAGVDLQ
jgi:hypothetical protein